MASQSHIRPYAEFGGGVLYQKPKITFSSPAGTSTMSESGSIGNFMYGGGVQFFGGRRWGMDLGFDGFTPPSN